MSEKNEIPNQVKTIVGFDESRIVNKDYLNSLDGIYKCGICFKIMDNPTDCETCGHSFCYECIKNLKCPFKCKNQQLKPSSQSLKDILSKLKFKCLNKDCNEILNYKDVKRHDKICDFQEIICPNNGCNKKLIKKNLENHILNECQFILVKCPYCEFQFNKNEISKHKKSCELVNNSLKSDKKEKNDINNDIKFDANKIDTNEYIKLLSMNVSKIVKENKELMEINNRTSDEEKKQKLEFSQVAFRPSNPSNYAQIDEDDLLSLISQGIDEELKKYFFEFDKNFLKLSKDIKDIKEYFYNKQNKNIKLKDENHIKNINNNIILTDEGRDKIDHIKEVKETEEENINDNYKDYIENIIIKTEDNIKSTISDMKEKFLDKLKEFNNKLEENMKKNNSGNINLTNQQKLIIENINNSIDKIIENIKETQSKINILSNDLHNRAPLFEELNKNLIISLREKNSKDSSNNMEKEKDGKNEDSDNMNKEIENIETTLNLIKNNLKQVIKTITEEFADLTELIIKKKDKENLGVSESNNLVNKRENLKEKELSIDSLHKFSFGMDFQDKNFIQSPNLLLSNKSTNQKNSINFLKMQNQNFFLNPLDSNNNELKLVSNIYSSNSENNNNNKNDTISNNQPDSIIQTNILNLENRMVNLENYTKNIEAEIKQDIITQFNNQVNNFNSIMEQKLDNKIGKMFSLKYCKECEKVDYFYGFKKCASCENEICKQCITLCTNCKILFCKRCCTCAKCNRNYCIKCGILCTECNKKFCKNCIINCSTCNKLLCLLCIKQCLNCKNNNCGTYCSKTCYICNKNICNKCENISEIKIIKCSSCNNNICKECLKFCEFCEKKICKNCEKICNKCNLKICKSCINGIGECFDCKKIFCKKCKNGNIEKKCEICNNIFCKECENKFINCYLCNQNICKNCCNKCLCGNIYCNICSLECEKCGRKVCNTCSAKCVCDIAIFCNECLKQNTETVLMHDCLYFINDRAIFDTKKTRSKISFDINNDFEIKLYIYNYNKISKLLIGFTDNELFKENADEEISNIYVINLINGKKYSSETKKEASLIDLNSIKEQNISVFLMVKNKKLYFKINNYDYKFGFDLTKDKYWLYLEKINSENTNTSNHYNSNNNNIEIMNDDYNMGIPKIKIIYAKYI